MGVKLTGEQDVIKKVRDALQGAPLAHYYATRSEYCGSTFASITPNPPNDVVAADLHAVSMLSVRVEPYATRQLLEPGPARMRVLECLSAVPSDVGLGCADDKVMDAMWDLQVAFKSALAPPKSATSNRWVTAAKLSARKRPNLIPVRDSVVTGALGNSSDARVYWRTLQACLNDPDVQQELVIVREQLARASAACSFVAHDGTQEVSPVVAETSALRLIDVALWMTYK